MRSIEHRIGREGPGGLFLTKQEQYLGVRLRLYYLYNSPRESSSCRLSIVYTLSVMVVVIFQIQRNKIK
jgi:hypothetical protein